MSDPKESKTRTGKEFKGSGAAGAKASPAKASPVSGKSDSKTGTETMKQTTATTEQPPSWLAF